jgi:ketosteroid isomerase-like protein
MRQCKEITMTTIQELDARLNDMIRSGKILDALDQYFTDDCEFREGNKQPRRGKNANREFLEGFFKSLKAFNGATLHSQAVSGNVGLAEWTFDMVGPEGPMIWNEVIRREWRGDKVVSCCHRARRRMNAERPARS